MSLQRMTRRLRSRRSKNDTAVPNRVCAACGHEVTGAGPEPVNCPACGTPWQEAQAA